MEIKYSLLRPELGEVNSLECETYKYEVHPVTGKFTLYAFEQRGTANHLIQGISSIVWFEVIRPR